MNEPQSSMPVGKSELFQTSSQHWAHAEQIRWTLLYNYLMASTILLLAWATVYAVNVTFRSRPWLLALLSGAGAVVSLAWIALGLRASSFVDAFAEGGRMLEQPFTEGIAGPFARAAEHRKGIRGCARLVTSRRVVSGVPALFTAVYLTLFALSLTWILKM